MPKYSYLFFNVFAIILLGIVVFLTLKSKNKYKNSFLILIYIALFSNVVYFGYFIVNNVWVMKIIITLTLMLEDAIICSLLAFTTNYTGHYRRQWFSSLVFGLIAVDYIFMIMNLFTSYSFDFVAELKDGYTYLLVKPHWLYRCHQGLNYFMFLLTMLLLLNQVIKKPKVYKVKYSSILFFSFLTVLINGIANLFSFRVDPTIFLYSISAIIFYFFGLRYTPHLLISKIEELIIDNMNDVLIVFDMEDKLLLKNKRADEVTGMSLDNVLVEDIESFYKNHKDRNDDNLFFIKCKGQTMFYDMEIKTLTDSKNRLQAKAYLFHDVTLRETEKRLREYENSFDDITGIYNRRFFFHRATSIYNDYPGEYDILVSNFEGFRIINEMFEISGGNKILERVAEVLNGIDREIGIIYGRMEGDKFAVLIRNEKLDKCLHLIRKRIEEIIERTPVVLKIGIASIPDGNVLTAYDRAIETLHYIAHDFSKPYAFYDESVNQSSIRNITLIKDFETSLKDNQFKIYLQPQINSYDNTVVGAEALVRWNHPKYGMISPGEFIPLLEMNMMIHKLDLYVWEEACRFLKKWSDKEHETMSISVNISTKDFYLMDVKSSLIDLKNKYGIDPKRLKLEITESAFISDKDILIKNVIALKKEGFIVEMDDFGSGSSSFNVLKDIPIDVLKLDIKFLDGDIENKKTEEILTSVISMAHRISIPVIAEGVENKEQCDLLQRFNCDLVQGYYYSKPMTLDEFEEYMKSKVFTSFISYWTLTNENKEAFSFFKDIHRMFNNNPISVIIVGYGINNPTSDNMVLYYANSSFTKENNLNLEESSMKTLDYVFNIKKEDYMPYLTKILNEEKTHSFNTKLRDGREAHINVYSFNKKYVVINVTYLYDDIMT